MGRIGELDGLRGLAILLVLVCHFGSPHLNNAGVAGVTTFFVLSGYLITSVLLRRSTSSARLALRDFWIRRARRILPALAMVMSLVVAGSFVLPGSAWWSDDYLAPVGLFYANWWYVDHGPLGVLAPTWSLAVEEQFYLLFPVVALVLGARRRIAVVAISAAIASFVVRLWLLGGANAIPRIYHGSDTASFALLLGVVLACLPLRRAASRRWLPAVSVVGLGALAMWPPGIFIVLGGPLVAALAAIGVWVVASGTRVRSLRWPPLRWLGERSYGLYLIHVPVLVALRDYAHLSLLVVLALGLPLALGLSELSWRFVESPVLRRRGELAEPGMRKAGQGALAA